MCSRWKRACGVPSPVLHCRYLLSVSVVWQLANYVLIFILNENLTESSTTLSSLDKRLIAGSCCFQAVQVLFILAVSLKFVRKVRQVAHAPNCSFVAAPLLPSPYLPLPSLTFPSRPFPSRPFPPLPHFPRLLLHPGQRRQWLVSCPILPGRDIAVRRVVRNRVPDGG